MIHKIERDKLLTNIICKRIIQPALFLGYTADNFAMQKEKKIKTSQHVKEHKPQKTKHRGKKKEKYQFSKRKEKENIKLWGAWRSLPEPASSSSLPELGSQS